MYFVQATHLSEGKKENEQNCPSHVIISHGVIRNRSSIALTAAVRVWHPYKVR